MGVIPERLHHKIYNILYLGIPLQQLTRLVIFKATDKANCIALKGISTIKVTKWQQNCCFQSSNQSEPQKNYSIVNPWTVCLKTEGS